MIWDRLGRIGTSRDTLPDRLTPAERDFFLELRRLVDTAGYSFRALEDVTSGNQNFFSKSQWGRWLNAQSLPPRRAVRALAGRLVADDIDAGHLIDLWDRAFVPGPGLRDLQQQALAAGPSAAGTSLARLAEDEPERALPRELPPTVPGFTGRSAELGELTRLLDRPGEQSSAAIVISAIGGTAGVGKTALAVQWAHQVADHFPGGQLYVNLRGYDPGRPVPASDALAGFLRALGVPGQDIPARQDERAARYRSLLSGKRVLVVLDNASSAEQVRPLLPGAPACMVVVTSRDALSGLAARDGAIRLDLDVLPAGDAVGLLRKVIGSRVDAEPVTAAELADQCCRLPLALRVAAELAAARPAMPLAGLTRELADLGTRLDLLETGRDPCTRVRTVFSWSYRHLDADAARAFRLLGLHPGPGVDLYAVAALTGAALPQARRALDTLARAHLIQPASPGRYGMHDLLCGYARELTNTLDTGQEQQAALTRLFDHYLHTADVAMGTLLPAERHRFSRIPRPVTLVPPLADPAAAQGWLDAERATLVAAAGHAAAHDWPGHATRLAVTLAGYLHKGAHFAEALAIFSHGLDAACRTGDRAAQATSLSEIGNVHHQQDRLQQAVDHYRQALGLFRETGDRVGEAGALQNLGVAEMGRGRYEHAARHQQEALVINRHLGDRLGEARALGELGLMRQLEGRYQEAAGYHQQALDVYREIGHRQHQARALASLGDVDRLLGRDQEAADYYEQALAILGGIGFASTEPWILARRGEVYMRLGRYKQATNDFEQALAMSHGIGNRAQEARALNRLGEVLYRTGNLGQARARQADALRLATEISAPRQQAHAHSGLASACHADGDPVQARHHWQQALTLYEAIGAPEARGIRNRLAAAGSDLDGRKPADDDGGTPSLPADNLLGRRDSAASS